MAGMMLAHRPHRLRVEGRPAQWRTPQGAAARCPTRSTSAGTKHRCLRRFCFLAVALQMLASLQVSAHVSASNAANVLAITGRVVGPSAFNTYRACTAPASHDLHRCDGPRMSAIEPPLTPAARVARAVSFWRRVVPVLGAYKLAEIGLQVASQLPPAAHTALRNAGVTIPEDAEGEAEMYNRIHEWGSEQLENTIKDLKGFYVKTGQVISTRVDLFPPQYTTRLASLQDDLDPMPFSVVAEVVERELLQGEKLDSIFSTFDETPLGSASIAQVHRATLLDGRVVAVKVQRPNCEPKLLGDIANLKSFSQRLASALPIDYYTVFCELERALQGELDFLAEAQSAMKVYSSVSHTVDGEPAEPSVVVPLPVQGLACRRVLVMDFVKGTPLNRLPQVMRERGIEPNSPESRIAGRRILSQLTEAFGRMILGAGFIHGDPHPGNIFIMEGARVALIDCGQVKQLSTSLRLRVAEALLLVNEWRQTGGSPQLIEKARVAFADFGVTFLPDAPAEAPAALALLLFGDAEQPMPGNFSSGELDDNSPLKTIASFPQELVLLGRATILIKGISKRLGINWPLSEKWAPLAEQALACGVDGCTMPTWSNVVSADAYAAQKTVAIEGGGDSANDVGTERRLRFGQVIKSYRGSAKLLRQWAVGKAGRVLPTSVKRLAARVVDKFSAE